MLLEIFLGRVLAGLDPNDAGFAALPPHFIVEGDSMTDNDIKAVMEIKYGQVLDKFDNQPEIDPRGSVIIYLCKY